MRARPLERRGDSAAAPVTPDGREAVLGPVGMVVVAQKTRTPDDLAAGERDEGAFGPRDPLALPILERNFDRPVDREILERLARELAVDALEEIGPFGQGDELDPRRKDGGPLLANRANLLDVAADLAEPETLARTRTSRRPRSASRPRRSRGAAHAPPARAAAPSPRRAAGPPGARAARGNPAPRGRNGRRFPNRQDSTVQLGEQEEGAGCGGAADLLDLPHARSGDGHPHLPPGLQVGIGLGGADDDHPLLQTDTCFRLSS